MGKLKRILMRKFIAVLTAIMLAAMLIPVAVSAENGEVITAFSTNSNSPTRIQPGQQVTQTVNSWSAGAYSPTSISYYYE